VNKQDELDIMDVKDFIKIMGIKEFDNSDIKLFSLDDVPEFDVSTIEEFKIPD
jgi:hypothetical protein